MHGSFESLDQSTKRTIVDVTYRDGVVMLLEGPCGAGPASDPDEGRRVGGLPDGQVIQRDNRLTLF